MDWQELPDAHACRIITYKSDVFLDNDETWQDGFAWLTATLEKMDKVLRPFISALQ